MNFSVHLPQPLLVNLDQFAKTHKISRSGVVRKAVEAYLAAKTKSEWPPEMLAWMQTPPDAEDSADWPDFDAIRKENNASWELNTARNLKDFEV